MHRPEGLIPAGCRGTSDPTGIGLAHLCVHENVLAEECSMAFLGVDTVYQLQRYGIVSMSLMEMITLLTAIELRPGGLTRHFPVWGTLI